MALQRRWGPPSDRAAESACFTGEKAHEAVPAGGESVLLVVQRHGDGDPPFCGSGAFVHEVLGV